MSEAVAKGGGDTTGAVDTRKVRGRRTLKFDSLDACLAEVARLREAEHAGKLKALGNWTLGQTLGHLAAWVEYWYVGFPMPKPPWAVRVVSKGMLWWFLNAPMEPGFRLPGAKQGTWGQEPCSVPDGEARLRGMFERLKREKASVPSPLFGMLPQEKLIKLHLRHAELHLGFFVPTEG
jgi:hypothetical protein